MVDHTHDDERPGYVATIVGAVVGATVGGTAGYRLGMAFAGEPTRTSENPLDDLFLNTFEVIVALVVVVAVAVPVLCAGVAVGVYVALRATRKQAAGATALLCVALDLGAIPLAVVVAAALNDPAPAVSLWAALAVLVVVVPLVARWGATRVAPSSAAQS